MTFLHVFLLFSTFIFGIIAIFFSFKEDRSQKKLREKENAQKSYQIEILKQIQDRIGYSLDIEKVIDVITGSLKSLFSYSTASSIVIKEDKLIFKSYIEEKVSHNFVNHVQENMIASLKAMLNQIPDGMEKYFSGANPDDTNPLLPSSFFNIPLVVNDKVVGLINVSSTKPNLYKEQEMTILYQITAQASNALSRLQEVLRSEEKKREDLTNMMVHELRAPLTAIKDSSELLGQDIENIDRNEQKKLLDIVHAQAKFLLNQIGEILDAAKLEAGKLTIQKKPQENIVTVIKESLMAFTPQASKKQILLVLEGNYDLPLFSFDPMRIGQVINNLLSNSLKFTPVGGRITVKVEMLQGDTSEGLPTARSSFDPCEGRLRLERALAGRKEWQDPVGEKLTIRISITDTGIGIPKEKQRYLFTKYSEASETKGSTGLGLYVVKGIVETHGGTVEAQSEQGKGTTISFTLPVEKEKASLAQVKQPIPLPSSHLN